MCIIFPLQIYGTGNPSYPCSSWTLDTNGHIQTSVLPPVKLQSSSTFPVAISMANSTTSAMKIMPPGPAGRSSPEGSQVSLLFISEAKYAAGLESFTNNCFVTIQFKLDAIKYKTCLPLCGSINSANWFTEANKQSRGYLAEIWQWGIKRGLLWQGHPFMRCSV